MQTEEQKESNHSIRNWVSINQIIHTLKMVCVGLMSLAVFEGFLCITLQDKTPIVVKDVAGELHYLVGSKKKVPIQKDNIERFIKKYIELRYEWDGSLNIGKVSIDIAPLVTDGFRAKTVKTLETLQRKDLKGKELDQGHTKPRIEITEKSTTASFDRVLRINGVPLVIPTQIFFNLVRGEVSYWNCLGLYINGVTIHEGP